MGIFNLKSKYKPAGDQWKAIERIFKYFKNWNKFNTLWWVTGSGKTFTMANIIEKMDKPTLIIAHNKTLAAQLAQEFKEYFPDNAVHYFVSYYDYYQPEAYVKKTDTYIEKEATINEEIDRLRHAATQDLLTRKDVIIVASVSCIYGLWDVSVYKDQAFNIYVWEEIIIEELMKKLIWLQYRRASMDFKPWEFQIHWDLVEIWPPSSETVYSFEFWWDEVTAINRRNYLTWEVYQVYSSVEIFPAKHTIATKDRIENIVPLVKKELEERLKVFEWDPLKTERLKTKVEYDLEMMAEVGYVNGIENYSMYLDWREPWAMPSTLMHYFGDDYLTIVDESHMTISQIWAMYAWDRSRKENLVESAFRLPSALENRPLKFDEFMSLQKNMLFVSATPSKFEIEKSSETPDDFYNFDLTAWKFWEDNEKARIVPQIIRPTWLLDPKIIVKDMEFMVDDIMNNINTIIDKNERMLITTLTKRSSEELTDYLKENWIKVSYLHSEIQTIERLEILKDLREWKIDVIVWVNLLREGLDLPEVSKIAIVDADKQWFLRSETSLIQIVWRAARNSNWEVIMYSKNNPETWEPRISPAMAITIKLTNFRRALQAKFNEENWITATTVFSSIKEVWLKWKRKDYSEVSEKTLEKELARLQIEMDVAVWNTNFEKAAEIRDEIIYLKKWIKK